MWCCKSKVLVLLAALVATAIHSPGASSTPHGSDMLAAGGHEKGGAYAVCTACHWIPHNVTQSPHSSWQAHQPSHRNPYAVPGNVSLMCLSCHDGAMAEAPPTSRQWMRGVSTLGVPATDFSDAAEFGHHPCSVDYPVNGDLFLLPLGKDPSCRLPLYSDVPGAPKTRLECATCHEIHTHGSGASLRVPSKNFELCLCCHRAMPGLTRHVYLPMQKQMKSLDGSNCLDCHDM